MRVIPILCQFQAYKGAGGATKKQLLQNLAYNQENIYIFQLLQTFFCKILAIGIILGRKGDILAKSHNSLRLHKPV